MKRSIATCLLLLGTPAAAFAQAGASAPPPDVFSRVTACRGIAENSARLACFDGAVAALAQAQAAREVVVVDRAQVQETRRSLFGLALPEVGRLFGEGQETAIEASITDVRQDQAGRTTFQVDGGAVWTQTEGRRLRARTGMKVRIRRGALGSFIANIGDQTGVRVIRQR